VLGLVCLGWSATSFAQSDIAPSPPVAAVDSENTTGPTNERLRIVLVVGPHLEELAARFVAELGSMHFDVVRVDATIVPPVDELEELARRHSARVAVRITRAGNAVDLWLVNPETHELVFRRVATDGDPAVVALRSLEILRGSLVDLQAHPVERPAEAPAAELRIGRATLATQPATRQPLWLGGSAALFGARLGRALASGASLGLSGGVSSRFTLRADLLLSLSDWTVEGEGGIAEVRTGGATVSALVTPWGERTLTPGLGLGVGALALYTRGEAHAGYLGSTDLNFAAFPHGRLELGLAPFGDSGEKAHSGSLRLMLAMVAGFATPRPVLVFGGDTAEAWLNPLWISSIGVEVALR
jgi:hypothetical protein